MIPLNGAGFCLGGLGGGGVPWACAHGGCYILLRHRFCGGRISRLLQLARIVDATQAMGCDTIGPQLERFLFLAGSVGGSPIYPHFVEGLRPHDRDYDRTFDMHLANIPFS